MWFKPTDCVNDIINLNLVTRIVVDAESNGAPPRHMVLFHFSDRKRPIELMLTVPKIQELEFFIRRENKVVTPPSDEPKTVFILRDTHDTGRRLYNTTKTKKKKNIQKKVTKKNDIVEDIL